MGIAPGQMKPLLAILVSGFSLCASADTLHGRVIGISDGDTVTVLDSDHRQTKVRLAGIDAPEKVQPYGQRSKQHLSQLVFGKEVQVEWTKRDRYGRTIGKILVVPPDCPQCGRTLDVNLAQLTTGMAWWYRQYAREQSPGDRERYAHAEDEARARKAGLWVDPQPTPPWVWRHR